MKRILAMSLAVSSIAAFAAFGTVGASAAPAKVTVCHATGSATHPYVELRLTERAADAHIAHGDTRGACHTTPPGGSGVGGLGKFDRRFPARVAAPPVTQLAATR